jgi:hypothetical protein
MEPMQNVEPLLVQRRRHPAVPAKPDANPRWINTCIIVGSALFVFGLAVSAVFAPEWRVLHVFQALIYVAIIFLTRRKSAWGFGAGFFVGIFWNALGLLATPLFSDGFQEVWSVIRTGNLQRPDLLLQLLAAGGHVLIIVACAVGFLSMRPGGRRWSQFIAGGVLVIGYLFAIVFAVGPPQGVALFKRAFGL